MTKNIEVDNRNTSTKFFLLIDEMCNGLRRQLGKVDDRLITKFLRLD